MGPVWVQYLLQLTVIQWHKFTLRVLKRIARTNYWFINCLIIKYKVINQSFLFKRQLLALDQCILVPSRISNTMGREQLSRLTYIPNTHLRHRYLSSWLAQNWKQQQLSNLYCGVISAVEKYYLEADMPQDNNNNLWVFSKSIITYLRSVFGQIQAGVTPYPHIAEWFQYVWPLGYSCPHSLRPGYSSSQSL